MAAPLAVDELGGGPGKRPFVGPAGRQAEGFARHAADHRKDVGEALAAGFIGGPAGEGLGDRVEQRDAALAVGDDDAVAEVPQGDFEAAPAVARGGGFGRGGRTGGASCEPGVGSVGGVHGIVGACLHDAALKSRTELSGKVFSFT